MSEPSNAEIVRGALDTHESRCSWFGGHECDCKLTRALAALDALVKEHGQLKQGLWPKSMVDLHEENDRLKQELERRPAMGFTEGVSVYVAAHEHGARWMRSKAADAMLSWCQANPGKQPPKQLILDLPTKEVA